MIIDGGLALFMIGILLTCAVPVERAIAQRRLHRAELNLRPPLTRAFPIVPPSPSLDQLARDAEAAIHEGDLARGVREVASVYANAHPPMRDSAD